MHTPTHAVPVFIPVNRTYQQLNCRLSILYFIFFVFVF